MRFARTLPLLLVLSAPAFGQSLLGDNQDLLKATPRQQFFFSKTDKGELAVLTLHVRVKRGELEVDVLRIRRGGRLTFVGLALDLASSELKALRVNTGVLNAKELPDWSEVVRGEVKGDELSIVEVSGGKERKDTLPWQAKTVPEEVGLFVYPGLRTKIAGPLNVRLFSSEQGETAPFVFTPKAGAKDGLEASRIQHTPSKAKVVVWSKKSTIQRIEWHDGSVLEAGTEERFRATLAKMAAAVAAQKSPSEETRALTLLKDLNTAQTKYREADADANGENDYAPNLASLGQADLINPELAKGTVGDYTFTTCRSSKYPAYRYMVIATAGKPGLRHFAITHGGVIHVSDSPIPLDPKACALPKEARPFGK